MEVLTLATLLPPKASQFVFMHKLLRHLNHFLILSLASGSCYGEILLNEINFNPPGTDSSEEYIELISTTGDIESTDGLTIVIVDGSGGKIGNIERTIRLNGLSTGANGLLLIGPDYTSPNGGPFSSVVSQETAFAAASTTILGVKSLGLDPNGGMTVFLVDGNNGRVGVDLDTNDDGNLDRMPWGDVLDGVGYGREVYAPAANVTQAFGPDNIGRLMGDMAARTVTAWYGGDLVVAVGGGSTVYDQSAFFGQVLGAATPGQVNRGVAMIADLLINEVNVNPPGNDRNFEYIEIISTNGSQELASGYTLVLLDTNNNGNPGAILEAWSLEGLVTGSNGLLLLGDSYNDPRYTPFASLVDAGTTVGDPPGLGTNDITNDALSLLLVTGFAGAVGADLDAENDGILDSEPWSAVRDSVGFGRLNLAQNANVTSTYAGGDVSQIVIGFTTDNASRLPGNTTANSEEAWYGGEFGGANGSNTSFRISNSFFGEFIGAATPGAPNLLSVPTPLPVRINEVNIDPPGSDNATNGEFIELISLSSTITNLSGYHLLLVATDATDQGGDIGIVKEIWELSGQSTGANGLFLIGDDFDSSLPAGFKGMVSHRTHVSDVNGFDIGDIGVNSGLSLLLVTGFNGGIGEDLDPEDDGSFIADLGFEIVDSIAFGNSIDARLGNVTPSSGFTPGNVSRLPGQSSPSDGDSWYSGIMVGDSSDSLTYSTTKFSGSYVGGATPGAHNHAATPLDANFVLNEINFNPAGSDGNFEYIELLNTKFTPASLSGYSLVVADSTGSNVGTVLEVWDLDGASTGSNGLLLLGDGYDQGGPHSASAFPGTAVADPLFLDMEDIGNKGVAVLLVRGFVGRVGQDLNDDRLTSPTVDDSTWQDKPWLALVDSIAIGEHIDPSFANLSGNFVPDNASRLNQDLAPNSTTAWYRGSFASTATNGLVYAYAPPLIVNGGSFSGNGAATPGAFNLGTASNFDDLVDADRDGVAKLVELALGMNPELSDVVGLPVAGTINTSGDRHASLTYNRLRGGSVNAAGSYEAGGFRYTIEYSPDLIIWSSEFVDIIEVRSEGLDDGFERVQVRLADTITDMSMFMRLRISR
jgi:hypothetical protein